tara:strand:- start:238 stop:720 length:483 start_codon:yes stop_codon:yes gene_type:complete
MAKRIGKYKVSQRIWDINQHDEANSSPESLAVTNNATVGGTLTVSTDGVGKDVIFYSGTAGDNMTWDASAEALILTGTAGQDTLQVADGDVLVTKGNVVLGANSTQAGNLTLWDGAGGNTPAWILLHSCDGTAQYYFAANDGTLRRHSSAPTANGDGSAV